MRGDVTRYRPVQLLVSISVGMIVVKKGAGQDNLDLLAQDNTSSSGFSVNDTSYLVKRGG